jgi:hypothetical protein
MSFIAAAGTAVAAYGAYNANRSARAQQSAQNQALAASNTTLGDFGYSSPGGQGGSYNNQTGQMEYSLGDLDPIRQALTRFAGSNMPTGGMPQGVTNAANQLNAARNPLVDTGRGQLDAMGDDIYNQFRNSSQGLTQQAQSGFQTGLQNTAFTGAGNQLASLNQTYGQVYDNTLGNLRSQADVTNQRNFANLNQNLFSTGRLGTSGGALQTEAFARGLSQADAGFQLQAQQQAQMAQQNQLGLAQGMTGIGSGLRSQQEDLLNNAFGRFTQSAGLASDLNNQRFQRSMYQNEQQYSRAQEGLGTQMQLAGFPAQLQGAQLQNVLQALQGQSGIQSQGLQNFAQAAQLAQAEANARIGGASNMAAIVGSPSYGSGGAQNAAMWGQLGTSLIQNSGQISSSLGRLFGGGGAQNMGNSWGAQATQAGVS